MGKGYYDVQKEYYGWRLDIVMRSHYHHLAIVHGVGGIGKTSFVRKYLEENYPDYTTIWVKGDVTAPALYRKLEELSRLGKGVLIWDNATHRAFSDPKIRNILEQATDRTEDGQRVVTYVNAKTLESGNDAITLMPTHKIIITTNYWMENLETQPLKDRAIVIEMDGELASKYAWELLRQRLSEEQYTFVRRAMSVIFQAKDNVPLTFRDALEISEAVQMIWDDPDRANKFAMLLLDKNKLLYTAYMIYRKYKKPYSKMAIREWTEITGKSRTYYVNMIKTLKDLGVIDGNGEIERMIGDVRKNILECINGKCGQKVVRKWSEDGQFMVI